VTFSGNPLGVEPPESIAGLSPELYAYLLDLNRTLHENYERQEAGAPSFPASRLMQRYARQEYPIGSESRFLHADFGVLRGIFVRFADTALESAQPVGWDSTQFGTGIVTANYAKSSSVLFVGLDLTQGPGEYGWVLSEGVVPATLMVSGEATSKFIEWTENGLELTSLSARLYVAETFSGSVAPVGSILMRGAGAGGGLTGLEGDLEAFFAQLALLSGKVTTLDEDFQGTVTLRNQVGIIEQRLKNVSQSVTYVNRVLAEFNPDSVIATAEETLAITRNYYNLTRGVAELIDGKYQQVIIQTNAGLSSKDQAKGWSDQSGIYAQISSERAGYATLRASESQASAEASFGYRNEAQVHRDDAGNYAASASASATLAAQIVGDAETVTALIEEESLVRANADSAMASQISTLSAYFTGFTGTVQSAITNEASARSSADAALTTQITSSRSSFSGAKGLTPNAYFSSALDLWVTPIGSWTWVGNAGNRAVRSAISVRNQLVSSARLAIRSNHKYRIRTRFTVIAVTQEMYFGIQCIDGSGNLIGHAYSNVIATNLAPGTYEVAHVVDTSVSTPVNSYGSGVNPGTTQITPTLLTNWSEAVNGQVDLAELWIEDVTDIVAANAAITTEATTRANADGALATQITTINAYFAGLTGATVQASINTESTTRANADTALALRSTNLEASRGQDGSTLNVNPNFMSWTSGVPTGWDVWGAAVGAAEQLDGGLGRKRLAMDFNPPIINGGYSQTIPITPGTYIVEVDVELVSGSWTGAGVSLGGATTLNFATDKDINGVVSNSLIGRRRFAKLATYSGSPGNLLYLMANWSGYGAATAKYLIFRNASIRSIDGGYLDASARITTEEQVRANADSVMAGQITTLNTTVGGHTSTLTTYGTSINGLNAKYGVTIDVDGYVTGFSLNGSGTTGEMVIRADKFRIAKSGVGTTAPIFDLDSTGLKLGVPLFYGNQTLNGEVAGFRLRHGAGFGTSNQCILWYGPTSVAFGSETRTNGIFCLGTDGIVYYGSAQLTAGSNGLAPVVFSVSNATAGTTELVLESPIGVKPGTLNVSGDGSVTANLLGGSWRAFIRKHDNTEIALDSGVVSAGGNDPIVINYSASSGLAVNKIWFFCVELTLAGGVPAPDQFINATGQALVSQ
jgi:hypothetical protein